MPRNNKRKEPVLDHYVKASVDHADNRHDRRGRYKTLTWNLDSSNYDHAREMRNALYRSAYHLNLCLDAEILELPDGRYQVTFTAVHPDYKERWSALETWKQKRREQKTEGQA